MTVAHEPNGSRRSSLRLGMRGGVPTRTRAVPPPSDRGDVEGGATLAREAERLDTSPPPTPSLKLADSSKTAAARRPGGSPASPRTSRQRRTSHRPRARSRRASPSTFALLVEDDLHPDAVVRPASARGSLRVRVRLAPELARGEAGPPPERAVEGARERRQYEGGKRRGGPRRRNSAWVHANGSRRGANRARGKRPPDDGARPSGASCMDAAGPADCAIMDHGPVSGHLLPEAAIRRSGSAAGSNGG